MEETSLSKYQTKSQIEELLNKKGTVVGSILLLCGSSIGVGILPLPILTGTAGSLPTLLIFALCCIYMTLTALLILEASLLVKDASFISISRKFLNRYGRIAVIISFLFLFYSLTTAYLAKGGELTNQVIGGIANTSFPNWFGPILLSIVSGALIFLGPFIVDYLNRFFMAGFFLTYILLSTAGIDYFNVNNLSYRDWSLSLFIIPFIITSFGYHNLVPLIGNYLDRDKKKSITTFVASGVILFFIYIIWVVGLHGILPLEGQISIRDSFGKGEIVTEPLARLIQSPMIQYSALYMACFAIITSILGQGLSIIDFLAEWFHFEKTFSKRVVLCVALFLPTLLCALFIPGVFFIALELAGGIAAMVIFGIIPACLGWVLRTHPPKGGFSPIVPGGKPMLIAVISVASFVIGYELIKNLLLW